MFKNTILFIGYFVPPKEISEEIRSYFGSDIKIAILYNKNTSSKKIAACRPYIDEEYAVDFNTQEPEEVIRQLGQRLFSVTTRGETFLEDYQRLIPVLKEFVDVPSSESVGVTMSKSRTREVLEKKYPEISTRYMEFDASLLPEHIGAEVLSSLKLPVIIKPIGLSTSMLVTRANTAEELLRSLTEVTSRLNEIYQLRRGRGEQRVIIEEFIDGDLYSIDAYVDKNGQALFSPLVKTTTGIKAGKQDYYGYFQVTPSGLNNDQIHEAEQVAQKIIDATGLTSSSAHIELMRNGESWFAIEIGARMGGYRTQLYKLSYGMLHSINDILVHNDPSKIKMGNQIAFAAMVKIYEEKEGVVQEITGLDKVNELNEVKVVVQNIHVGEKFMFAKNGGVSLFEIIIAADSEAQLRAVLGKIESVLVVKIG